MYWKAWRPLMGAGGGSGALVTGAGLSEQAVRRSAARAADRIRIYQCQMAEWRLSTFGGEWSSAKLVKSGPLAQRLVQRTHNPLVDGSNPSGPTIAQAQGTIGAVNQIIFWGLSARRIVCGGRLGSRSGRNCRLGGAAGGSSNRRGRGARARLDSRLGRRRRTARNRAGWWEEDGLRRRRLPARSRRCRSVKPTRFLKYGPFWKSATEIKIDHRCYCQGYASLAFVGGREFDDVFER